MASSTTAIRLLILECLAERALLFFRFWKLPFGGDEVKQFVKITVVVRFFLFDTLYIGRQQAHLLAAAVCVKPRPVGIVPRVARL